MEEESSKSHIYIMNDINLGHLNISRQAILHSTKQKRFSNIRANIRSTPTGCVDEGNKIITSQYQFLTMQRYKFSTSFPRLELGIRSVSFRATKGAKATIKKAQDRSIRQERSNVVHLLFFNIEQDLQDIKQSFIKIFLEC